MNAYLRDLGERVLVTFLGAFGAALIAADWFSVPGIQDASTLGQAAIAGVAAVLSLVKGIVATRIGDPGSASLSPGVGAGGAARR